MLKTVKAFAVAAVLAFSGGVSAEDVWDGDVLVLNDDSLEAAVAKYEYLLVDFYAPWW